ncbi:MAG: glycoside hydrolase family 57 protein [Bacillota bacterium]
MAFGYLALVLHAHLPFVRHPEDEYALEEKWLYEAITETYIPLLRVFERLSWDGIPFRLTISLSPPLISMLADPLLQSRYLKHLTQLRELVVRELERTKHLHQFHPVVELYHQQLEEAFDLFHNRYQDNLISAFKRFQDEGSLEIITCAGTHGYLPLIGLQREVVRAQVDIAVSTHTKLFGSSPRGIWLPECGYNPGDDAILRGYGIKFFLVDSHGILFGSPRPRYGIFAPINCPSGVSAFARDIESSEQVWSAQEGYPGDFDYREFYRDIGYDLDYDYIKGYIHPSGIRTDTGMKYFRITGKTEYKEPYIPYHAREKAAIHAGNFMFNREKQIEHLSQYMDRPPMIISPYDAELFGHWWFEGPMWLEYLIRKINFNSEIIKLISPGDYLEQFPENQPATPCMSSWGNNGYNEVWLEGSNDWIYRHLHHAADRMIELSNTYRSIDAESLVKRALDQAARELYLAQSSDWAFIMKTGTMVPYAVRRTVLHTGRLLKLDEQIRNGNIDETWLKEVEDKDNLFPEVDYRAFQSV